MAWSAACTLSISAMARQENTAINDLIGRVHHRSASPDAEPLFAGHREVQLRPSASPAMLVPRPIGAPLAPMPRRRAPSATPNAFRHPPEIDDEATRIDPSPPFAGTPVPGTGFDPFSSGVTGFDERATVQLEPEAAQARLQATRHRACRSLSDRAFYTGPIDAYLTARVSPLPPSMLRDAPRRRTGARLLRMWPLFAVMLGVSVGIAGYRVLGDPPADAAPPPRTTAVVMMPQRAIVMTPEPVAHDAVEPIAEADVAAQADPATPAITGTLGPSPWQPTATQPTVIERGPEPAAEPAAEVAAEPAAEAAAERVEPTKRSRRARSRSRDRRRERARARAEARTDRAVAIAAARPMKIAGEKAAAAGTGKLTVRSTPVALIYVDGRNTGLTTPRTLSLPAGVHKITLLTTETRKAKTVRVEIEAGKASAMARSF